MVAAGEDRSLQAFSIRKEAKGHGVGGRLVGPIEAGTPVAILEDTTTTGTAAIEAAEAARDAGLEVVQAIALVDRSKGVARDNFNKTGVSHIGLVTPDDLGVSE